MLSSDQQADTAKEAPTDRVHFVTYQRKRILLVDMTDCSPEEVTAAIEKVRRVVAAQPRESVLILSDLTGAQFTRDVVTRLKEVVVLDQPFVKKSAMVGAEALPEVFYQALKTFSRREFPRFKSRKEAMDWLVAEEVVASAS